MEKRKDITPGREGARETLHGREEAIKIWYEEEKEKRRRGRHYIRKRRIEGNN